MKNSFVLLLTCLFMGSINAQETYFPLIETDKTWHVMESHYPSTTLTFTYKFEGDTIISDKNYNILYRSDEEYPTNWMKWGYIREEEDKKIFYSPYNYIDTIFQEPALVYDFNVKINDTITITSFAFNYPVDVEIVITLIDSILINDTYRTRTFYKCAYSDDNFWIEGIGSDNGLTGIGLNCYDGCIGMSLLCVKNIDELLYMNDYYNDCYIVGIKENAISKQQFLVYPNPAKEEIFITTTAGEIKEFTFILYNLESEVVLQEKVLNFNQTKVKLENLKAGIYLYRITENEQMLQNGKIIIKN